MYGQHCGYEQSYPSYGYPAVGGVGYGCDSGYPHTFVLIVVLFILLIIIGASCYGKE